MKSAFTARVGLNVFIVVCWIVGEVRAVLVVSCSMVSWLWVEFVAGGRLACFRRQIAPYPPDLTLASLLLLLQSNRNSKVCCLAS